MAFDLWQSNRTNPIICKLHKQIVGQKLKYDTKVSCIFRVREVKERTNDDTEIGNIYKSSKDLIILETNDKVLDLKRNDYVEYLGSMYIVMNVNVRVVNQQMFTNKNTMSRKTTFVIRGATQ